MVAKAKTPVIRSTQDLGQHLKTLSPVAALAEMRMLTSVIDDRIDLGARAGITFDGRRDMYRALGYKRYLRPRDYRVRYERDGIAARVIDTLPQATWRGGGELVEDENPETLTTFESDFAELNERLDFWGSLRRADQMCGLGRFAIIFFGCPGDLDKEVGNVTADQVMYLDVFGEEETKVQTWETRPENPRYGQPTMYTVRRLPIYSSGTVAPDVSKTLNIHWSRTLHMADGLLDNHVFGRPRMKNIWNLFDDLTKVVGGGSEAYWRRADPGTQLSLDPAVKRPTEEELQELDLQIDRFINGLDRVVRTRGVEMKTLAGAVADFSNPTDAIMTQISASSGIPKRILMGSERGELASSQDRDNFNDRVLDRRRDFAVPRTKDLVNWLISHRTIAKPKKYEVRWPATKDLSDVERVAIANEIATMNKTQMEAGDTIVVTSAELRDRFLNLPPLDEITGLPASNVILTDAERKRKLKARILSIPYTPLDVKGGPRLLSDGGRFRRGSGQPRQRPD